MDVRRILTVFCVLSLLAAAVGAELPASDADLAAGVRQVQDGDFEGALLTLDGVVQRLDGMPARSKDVAQAHLYLGVAYVALGQRERAKASFRLALVRDSALRLGPDRFSPKVRAVFEEVRREAPAPARGGGGKAGLVVLGVGGAAAGVVVATRGSDAPGTARFANARFGTPVIVCPNGSIDVPIGFTILVDATNDTDAPVTIASATSTIVIVASAFPSEIGLASSYETTVVPAAVAGKGRATLEVRSTLRCDNGSQDSPRFNEWSGRVTLTTSAGVFALDAADRMRVNVP